VETHLQGQVLGRPTAKLLPAGRQLVRGANDRPPRAFYADWPSQILRIEAGLYGRSNTVKRVAASWGARDHTQQNRQRTEFERLPLGTIRVR
jgi:hypothetical protein